MVATLTPRRAASCLKLTLSRPISSAAAMIAWVLRLGGRPTRGGGAGIALVAARTGFSARLGARTDMAKLPPGGYATIFAISIAKCKVTRPTAAFFPKKWGERGAARRPGRS